MSLDVSRSGTTMKYAAQEIDYSLCGSLSHEIVCEEPFSIFDVINITVQNQISSILNYHQVGTVLIMVHYQFTNTPGKNQIKSLPGHCQVTARSLSEDYQSISSSLTAQYRIKSDNYQVTTRSLSDYNQITNRSRKN